MRHSRQPQNHILSGIPSARDQDLGQDGSDPDSDFHKLMKICSSYGLNSQETTQLISEFKRGALFSSEPSFSREEDSQGEVTFNHKTEEDYSFKHQGQHHPEEDGNYWKEREMENYQEEKSPSSEQHHSNAPYNDGKQSGRQDLHASTDWHEVLASKLRFEERLYDDLRKENQLLREELSRKDEEVRCLIDMKKQDSDIILGLKDILKSLTSSLRERELACQELQVKCNSLLDCKSKWEHSLSTNLNLNNSKLRSQTEYLE